MRRREPIVLGACARILTGAIERARQLEARIFLVDLGRHGRGESSDRLVELVGLRVRDAKEVAHRRRTRARGLADECGLERWDHLGVAARLERCGGGLERAIDLHHLCLVRARREHRALGARQR